MVAAKIAVAPVPTYAALFARQQQKAKSPLAGWQSEQFEKFEAEGFPTQRAELWKYTGVARALNVDIGLAPKTGIGMAEVSRYFAGGPLARRLIFVNGHFSRELSHVGNLPKGVAIKSLGKLIEEDPAKAAKGLKIEGSRSLTDLNAAFLGEGAHIVLADGLQLEQPIQLLFLNVGGPDQGALMTNPRLQLRLGDGARMHLIESHIALKDGHFWTNLVSQIELSENADLTHDRLQLGREGTTMTSALNGHVGGKSKLKQTLATLGGALMRNESVIYLDGEEIDVQLNGALMPKGKELVDNLIHMHHLAPNCVSDQFYRSAPDDHSRAVFAGKIFVYQAAQKTNAFQTNNNLLLSDDAEINSKPELEIYADDVKCSHGATCGELDETSLFYLRSRGLDENSARSLLTYAFIGEVFTRFADETLRKQAMNALFDRMEGGEVLKGMLSPGS